MATAAREGGVISRLTAPDAGGPGFVRGVSLLGAVAIVVGNMVGTSMYTLPASLAQAVGPLGIVAWALTACGYLGVAIVYAELGQRFPRTGGPYVYAREAFGDFAGFISFWLYWISAMIGNAGIVTGVLAYTESFVPALASHPVLRLATAQVLLWTFCVINILGIRHSTRVQIAIMTINLGGLLVLLGWSSHAIHAENYTPFAPKGWSSLVIGMAMICWAYSGVETATVPAEEMHDARTIRRGTMIGYLVGTVVFLLAAVTVAGVLPNDQVASSARPIAMVVDRAVGPLGARLISACAIVAGLGTLNGWLLVCGRAPVSAARDGLFFRSMATLHARFRTPAVALVAGTAVGSAMLFMMLSRTLLEVFDFIVLLSVWSTLVPHLISAAAYLALVRRQPDRYTASERRRAHLVAPFAFVAMTGFVYGSGAEIGRWGFVLLAAGMLAYVYFTRANPRATASWPAAPASSPGRE